MQRRWLVIGILVVGILAVLLSLPSGRPPEPTYHGRTLSHWLLRLGVAQPMDNPTSDAEAAEALRQIGPKAVPYLLEWMHYQSREDVLKFCRKYRILKWVVTADERKTIRANAAAHAFEYVGPEGQKALPDLLNLFNASTSWDRACRAPFALAHISPEGLPPLIAGLTNQDQERRVLCALAIGYAGTNAAPALPALIGRLRDPDDVVKQRAAFTLGRLKLQPALVVPALTEAAMRARSPQVRHYSILALENFGPQARLGLPNVQQALTDENPAIREAATNMLIKIAAQAAIAPAPK